ncbi:hypothetical protein Tco_0424871 [Tanacetum coccineum]
MPEDPYSYVVAAFHAPPSPDYIPGLEEPQSPPPPDFVPEPVYLEFIPPEDEVLPAEEQPLPAAALPTTDSPGYVPESDPEEDSKADDDEDPEEDPVDYPADRDNDEDDEEEEPSEDEADDEDEDVEEEEHPALADSIPPPPAPRVMAMISIQPQTSAPFLFEEDAERFLAIPTPPPSPLTPLSSPLPQIPSPPLLVSPPVPVLSSPPASPIRPLGYRAAMIRLRAEAPSTSHSPSPHIILSHTKSDAPPLGTPPSGTPPLLPIPLPTSSLPLHLLSTDHRADRLEVTLLPRKRLGIAFGPRYEVGESSSAPTDRPTGGLRADYGFVSTMDREIRRDLERDVGYEITDT